MARTLGVSLKRLDGWEPKQVHRVVEWTDDGRPLVWETITEPEWDRRQRSLMAALAEWEAGLCRRCGQHLTASSDPDTDPDNPDAHRRWVAEETQCFACTALHRHEQQFAPRPEGESGGTTPDIAASLIHTAYLIHRPGRGRR